jgi:hypothetical protein
MEFPRLVYRCGTQWALETGTYDVQTVADFPALHAAQLAGWHLDQYAARAADAAAKAPRKIAAAELADDAPPTRDELEQQASKLGIPFGPRTSDKKLRALVDAAMTPQTAEA